MTDERVQRDKELWGQLSSWTATLVPPPLDSTSALTWLDCQDTALLWLIVLWLRM